MRPVLLALLALLAAVAGCRAPAADVRVPADIDHAAYEQLLQRHVDERGLVDYDAWRASPDDRRALEAYLAQYDQSGPAATGAERHAALVNLYNAACIRMVLDLDPERSLWDHDPFTQRIHRVGGALVSLDDVEHGAVRPEVGYRGHAVLVCAARSCPPLWDRAFTADGLDRQLDERFAAWLAREDLNRFHPDRNLVELSRIFDWFAEDFERAGGIPAVLARHGPEEHREFLASGDYEIEYLDYDKGLNAQGR